VNVRYTFTSTKVKGPNFFIGKTAKSNVYLDVLKMRLSHILRNVLRAPPSKIAHPYVSVMLCVSHRMTDHSPEKRMR
jgi:hypothetical protein